MPKRWFVYLGGLCVVAVVLVIILSAGNAQLRDILNRIHFVGPAAAFFVQSITIADLHTTYKNANSPVEQKVKILIVPGHEPFEGGTEFRGSYEREIVVDIADELAQLLRKNPRFEVTVARTKYEWHPILANYFVTHRDAILAFIQAQSAEMAQLVAVGRVLKPPAVATVYHNRASDDTVLHLYGINKWASEQGTDVTLHLHINDYPGRVSYAPGEHSGFAIYVPDKQYSNAGATKSVAHSIYARLAETRDKSTLPKEDAGVVEDQDLIAVGAKNTSDGTSMLIEYGYIYEPQFIHTDVLPLAEKDLAYATYLGLQDFFHDPVQPQYESLALPHTFSSPLGERGSASADIYALQMALHHLGFYPPNAKTLTDCPISGYLGSCTLSALKSFQTSKGFEATGTLGPATRGKLNALIK